MLASPEKLDVIIIGGGPAGMSAALWCSDLGLRSMMFEKGAKCGGQLSRIFNPVENYLGLTAENGEAVREMFERSLIGRDVSMRTGVEVTDVDVENKSITTSDGSVHNANALILSTGVRRRRTGVPGEPEFEGKGIMRSGSEERASAAGKRVVVIGGGDAAAENALILAEYASRVHIVHRRPEMGARAEFIERIHTADNIEFIPNSVLERIDGRDHLERIEIREVETRAVQTLETEFLIVRIGVVPNSELIRGKVETDRDGYVIVDRECRTNRPGIYAVGDVANPVSPTIASAAGMGATAVKSAFALLSASK